MPQQREERHLRRVGVADIHEMETGPRLGEPQKSCQHPGAERDGAGDTQGTGEEEEAPQPQTH